MEQNTTATIEKLIPGGNGLARVDGMAVFIAGALPGETVRYRILKRKKGWASASLLEVLEPSSRRREPFCPLYSVCGGCDWQHMDEQAQLDARIGFCREALVRQGGLSEEAIPEIVPFSSSGQGYRARIRPVILNDGGAAFRGKGTGKTVPVRHCPVATPGINRFLADPPGNLKAGSEPIVFAGEDRYFLEGRDNTAIATIAGREFRFPPAAFFQSNLLLLPELIDFALGHQADTGQINESRSLALDLYGGVGLFGAFLGERYDRVLGVDRDPSAREAWERHVGPTGRYYSDTLERWITRTESRNPDFVVVDPPRGGLDSSVRQGLLKLSPPEISYVSCDPVTQARDLRDFVAGGYRLDAYAVFDLYPQTAHVETVARLVRRNSR